MRRASWLLIVAFSCAVIGASCAANDPSDTDDASDVQLASPTSEASIPTTASEENPTTSAPTTSAPTTNAPTTNAPTTSAPTTAPDPGPSNDPPADCVVISDFDSDADRSLWQIVNDDVMGGRSLGDRRFVGDTMVFEGSINTNGGGFSSLRRPVEPGMLAGMSTIHVRGGSDGRTYMLTVEDALDGRDRRVSHRSALTFDANTGVATVPVADLTPAIFGQPVVDRPIVPELVDEIGLMVSDGIDGDFRLDVAWLAACP